MPLTKGIYIITGIMASGKSTIAQLLAEQPPRSVHLRGDIFRRMIVNGYAEAGFTVILQDNYLGKEIETLLGTLTSSPLYLITLDPSADAVTARDAGRGKTGYHSWDAGALRRVLVSENPRIGLWIDSSNMGPQETVDAILRDIGRARIR